MQYNSYAIRSQSVLTTNSTGRVIKFNSYSTAQPSTYTSEIASIPCLHNFFRNTLLSCDLSVSRQSTVSTENSRSSATTVAQAGELKLEL